MTSPEVTIEALPNGLIRLYDPRCQWAALYDRRGMWHSGADDTAHYRYAVLTWLLGK